MFILPVFGWSRTSGCMTDVILGKVVLRGDEDSIGLITVTAWRKAVYMEGTKEVERVKGKELRMKDN